MVVQEGGGLEQERRAVWLIEWAGAAAGSGMCVARATPVALSPGAPAGRRPSGGARGLGPCTSTSSRLPHANGTHSSNQAAWPPAGVSAVHTKRLQCAGTAARLTRQVGQRRQRRVRCAPWPQTCARDPICTSPARRHTWAPAGGPADAGALVGSAPPLAPVEPAPLLRAASCLLPVSVPTHWPSLLGDLEGLLPGQQRGAGRGAGFWEEWRRGPLGALEPSISGGNSGNLQGRQSKDASGERSPSVTWPRCELCPFAAAAVGTAPQPHLRLLGTARRARRGLNARAAPRPPSLLQPPGARRSRGVLGSPLSLNASPWRSNSSLAEAGEAPSSD